MSAQVSVGVMPISPLKYGPFPSSSWRSVLVAETGWRKSRKHTPPLALASPPSCAIQKPMSKRVLAPDTILARIGTEICWLITHCLVPGHVPPPVTHGSVLSLTMQVAPFWEPPTQVPSTAIEAIVTSLALQMFGWVKPVASRMHCPAIAMGGAPTTRPFAATLKRTSCQRAVVTSSPERRVILAAPYLVT